MTWALCVASGPSLTRADCDALRGKAYTIAANCAVFFAPWADEAYGADQQFWKYYGPKLLWFKGKRVSRTRVGPDVETWHGRGWPRAGGNSGYQALQKAADNGFKRIALLGYDHQHTGGKAHFHGDHPRNRTVRLGNAKNVHHWVKKMEYLAPELERRGIEVVNLSRETALDCFPRMTVDEWLDYRHHPRSE